jgi:TetR/AcrR family transcriptional regulator, transcriptional repressor for nem operon
VKVSSEKVAKHREALLATARRLLQERGFDGAAVAEISRAAGLTQGALYGQFKSKDALATEAIRKSFAEGVAAWEALRGKEPDALSAFLDAYLCEAHARDPGAGCALAACVSEIGRQDPAIVAAYAEGFRQLATSVQQVLPIEAPPDEARRRALALLSGMVGSVAIARALEKADPELSSDVLAAAREQLVRLATAPQDGPDAG